MKDGAVLRRHVGGVEDVLDADRHAVQRANRFSFETKLIQSACLRERVIRIEERPRLNLLIYFTHACKARFDELLRSDNALANQTRGL